MKKFRFIIGWIMIICTVNLSAQTVNGMQFCNNNEAKNDSLSRTTLKVVINGLLCEIEDKIPADTLDENGRIQQIINEEFADLKEYEITDCKILKNIQIGCGNPQTPLLIITTKLPYYRNEYLVGNYRGKQGKLIYELSLHLIKPEMIRDALYPKSGIVEYGRYPKGMSSSFPAVPRTIFLQVVIIF